MFSEGAKTNRAHKPWKCRIMAAVDALAVPELIGVEAVGYKKSPHSRGCCGLLTWMRFETGGLRKKSGPAKPPPLPPIVTQA